MKSLDKVMAMKNVVGIKIGMLFVICLLLSGCVTIFKLKVVNGTGSGRYEPFATVPITADKLSENVSFDEWVGDISGIENASSNSTTILLDQLDKTIYAVYTNNIIPVPAFTNPYCGTNNMGTYSEYFRNKYQYQPSGHAGAKWRCKFAWPSYAVNTLGLTKQNAVTRIYKRDTMDLIIELPIYAIDGGETGRQKRANSEWFDPDITIPVRVELYINGVLSMRMKFDTVSTQYQGPLRD